MIRHIDGSIQFEARDKVSPKNTGPKFKQTFSHAAAYTPCAFKCGSAECLNATSSGYGNCGRGKKTPSVFVKVGGFWDAVTSQFLRIRI